MTHNQVLALIVALGDGHGWPMLTTDPYVNATVDYLVDDENPRPWEMLTEEEKEVYREEAEQP